MPRNSALEVREETLVAEVLKDGDTVTGLKLSTGETVRAKYYVDASGHVGTLRRAMGVETHPETSLQNIAFWDYWENAEWAIEIGVGATRVQVMSQAAGWMWFIPLGPTRTSIGYIVPADHYKSLGKTPEAVYHEAIANDDRISALVKNATPRGMVEATKDWSFTADTGHGDELVPRGRVHRLCRSDSRRRADVGAYRWPRVGLHARGTVDAVEPPTRMCVGCRRTTPRRNCVA